MYLSGFRGLWITIGFFLLVYVLVQRRMWVFVGAIIATLPVLPAVFYERLTSVVDLGNLDSSELDRIGRPQYAFNLLKQSPWIGWGWAAAGYVHSDLLQVAANLGLPAAAFFILWLLNLMRSLFGCCGDRVGLHRMRRRCLQRSPDCLSHSAERD